MSADTNNRRALTFAVEHLGGARYASLCDLSGC